MPYPSGPGAVVHMCFVLKSAATIVLDIIIQYPGVLPVRYTDTVIPGDTTTPGISISIVDQLWHKQLVPSSFKEKPNRKDLIPIWVHEGNEKFFRK